MFDIGIGFSEVLLLAVITILVVGPEDLPAMLRTIGRYVGQVKKVADQFRREFDEALKETEIDKLGKPMEGLETSPETDLAIQRAEALIDFEEHNRMILEKERLDGATEPSVTAYETPTEKALRQAGVKGLEPPPSVETLPKVTNSGEKPEKSFSEDDAASSEFDRAQAVRKVGS